MCLISTDDAHGFSLLNPGHSWKLSDVHCALMLVDFSDSISGQNRLSLYLQYRWYALEG